VGTTLVDTTMRRSLGLLFSLLLLVIGISLWSGFYLHSPPSQIVAIPLDSQRSLMGRLYTPTLGAAPYPAMLLLHGASSTKEMTEPLAVELARRGVAFRVVVQNLLLPLLLVAFIARSPWLRWLETQYLQGEKPADRSPA